MSIVYAFTYLSKDSARTEHIITYWEGPSEDEILMKATSLYKTPYFHIEMITKKRAKELARSGAYFL